jgi:excinuclease ABC subunit A
VNIPLGTLVCVTGPSGSGKSTLVEATIYAALARFFKVGTPPQPNLESMTGTEHLRTVCLIDQEPIGKTPRSNPITYLKAFQDIT